MNSQSEIVSCPTNEYTALAAVSQRQRGEGSSSLATKITPSSGESHGLNIKVSCDQQTSRSESCDLS
jgi:hypothetical protein